VNLLLFPGAGSSSSHPSLLAIARAVAPMKCVRADFPYRKAGRKAPDRAPVLMQTVREEAGRLRRGGLVLGGRSMGGRMCSMVVGDAEDPLPAKGLVLISYPLHPPGKPDSLRVEHLSRITVPCLFVHGTTDPFGRPDERSRCPPQAGQVNPVSTRPHQRQAGGPCGPGSPSGPAHTAQRAGRRQSWQDSEGR